MQAFLLSFGHEYASFLVVKAALEGRGNGRKDSPLLHGKAFKQGCLSSLSYTQFLLWGGLFCFVF